MSTNKKPFDKVQLGSIHAAIWQNAGTDGRHYYSVTFEKRYRDAQGNWQSTTSYQRDDMLVLAKVTDKVYDLIQSTQSQDRAQASVNNTAQVQQRTAAVR